jgi:hypothetical protein
MRRLLSSAGLALLALSIAAVARGELVQKGNLRISFDGRITPHALPRSHMAPVTVHLDSAFSTVDGSRPPQLRKMSVAVNRAGRLSLAGLPTCPPGELEQTSTAAALALCRGALVGHGAFEAEVDFPSTPLIPVHGRALAFNGRVENKPAILLHIYNSTPVRLAFVIPFTISRPTQGEFGTIFSSRIPHIAADRGYVTHIQLTLHRKYEYRGARRSVFSADCAAPPGFPGAVFPFARATFVFADGRRVTSSLRRDCRVR